MHAKDAHACQCTRWWGVGDTSPASPLPPNPRVKQYLCAQVFSLQLPVSVFVIELQGSAWRQRTA